VKEVQEEDGNLIVHLVPDGRLSIPLSIVLATWVKEVAWQVVGRFFGFHWNTVRKAVKDVVDYGLMHRDC
jgi:hypothetical protein